MIVQTYTVTTDNINGPKLHNEIADAGVVEGFLGVTKKDTPTDNLIVHGDSVSDVDALTVIVLSHNPEVTTYRILDLVSEPFKDYPLRNIDFSRHLKDDLALDKTVTKTVNGRPTKAEYTLDGVLVAKIIWEFETTESNLITRRTEKLRYADTNNEWSPKMKLKDRTFDMAILEDGEFCLTERENARKSIITSIKAFVSGVMMTGLGYTLEQCVDAIHPYWEEYASQRMDFIELGSHDWKDAMVSLDLSATAHTWLAIPVREGVTVRDYIVSRLTY